ncbi:MAG: hypothetical protein VX335_00895 [Pseudomonadota bacterium]|nr:hypothetical protein [Pseudomonadota bacterium]
MYILFPFYGAWTLYSLMCSLLLHRMIIEIKNNKIQPIESNENSNIIGINYTSACLTILLLGLITWSCVLLGIKFISCLIFTIIIINLILVSYLKFINVKSVLTSTPAEINIASLILGVFALISAYSNYSNIFLMLLATSCYICLCLATYTMEYLKANSNELSKIEQVDIISIQMPTESSTNNFEAEKQVNNEATPTLNH